MNLTKGMSFPAGSFVYAYKKRIFPEVPLKFPGYYVKICIF